MKTTSIKIPTIEELEAKFTSLRAGQDAEVKKLEELSSKIDELNPVKRIELKAEIGLQISKVIRERFAKEKILIESLSVYTLADYAKQSKIVKSVCATHNLYVYQDRVIEDKPLRRAL